jgi:exosome complex exonuclease RRP6
MAGTSEEAGPEFAKALFGSLVHGTRLSNELPAAEQRDYAATFPPFTAAVGGIGGQLTEMMAGFMEQQAQREAAQRFEQLEEVADRFESLVDLSDRLLERVDTDLDAARGLGPQAAQTLGHLVKVGLCPGMMQAGASQTGERPDAVDRNPNRGTAMHSAMSAGSAARRQMRWRAEVDNSDQPFLPKLRSKPHALVPLQLVLTTPPDEAPGVAGLDAAPRAVPHYSNPYEHEIAAFQPDDAQLAPPAAEQMYPPLHATPCHWVDTEPALQQLRARLQACPEFAVDLEAHSYRSYRGFVCLMQISTRDEDFLIDALELRSSLHVLNDAFTDPRITKVLHGGDSDVLWLQRDFGLYLVGMFDTGQAARVLEMPSFSLAHLLKAYCGVTVNKTYQLADWRIRPLTEEMVTYARQDTHYLLYVHDRLKHELYAQQRTAAVWQRSAELCRQAYKVVPLSEDDHTALLRRQNAGQLLPHQVSAHRALFRWRDALAREEDESCSYVLPNHLLLKLAQAGPRTPEQLRMICHPLPPLLNYHTASLLAALAGAVDGPDPRRSGASVPAESSGYLPMGPLPGRAAEACRDGVALAAGMPGLPWAPPLHPMQPSIPSAASHPAPMPPPPASQPHRGRQPASPQRPPSIGSSSVGGGGAGSVRRPPTPSRSPPLSVDHLYEAAGWVSRGAGEIASALMADGNGRQRVAVSAGASAGLFDGWTSGSSSEEDEAAVTAQGVEAQLNISPLWVLDMFAPPGKGAAKAGREAGAVEAQAEDTQARLAAPRSLNEIYKLSNLNKRRGVGRSDVAAGGPKAGIEGWDEGEEAAGEESGEESGGEEGDASHQKRRKGGGAADADGWSGPSKEHTEEFMRRIGWLRPDANLGAGDSGEPGATAGSARTAGFASPAASAPTADAAGQLLPYQRQQMSLGLGLPAGLPPHMSMAQPSVQQQPVHPSLLQQQEPLPPPQAHAGGWAGSADQMGRPPGMPHADLGKGKAGGKSRHKKRTGLGGEAGYEAPVPASAFVYNMGSQPQQGGKGGKGAGGGKGTGFGGRGGGGKHGGGGGGRSMTFGPSGGGRRY